MISLVITISTAHALDQDTIQETLMGHGTWHTTDYGEAWQPDVAKITSWRPYTRGQWVHTDHGWAWKSNEAFGGITYHYGRWALTPKIGWVWVPDTRWAPSWVAWRASPDFIGWAPLPPESLNHPNQSWNSSVDVFFSLGANHYAFIPAKTIDQVVTTNLLHPDHNPTRIRQTANVTKISVREQITSDGPDLDQLGIQLKSEFPTRQIHMSESRQSHQLVLVPIPEPKPEPVVIEKPVFVYRPNYRNGHCHRIQPRTCSITYTRTLSPARAKAFLTHNKPQERCHPRHQDHKDSDPDGQ